MLSEVHKFEARDLVRAYGHGKNTTLAVDHVSFRIKEGQVVSVVGQSGSGKTVLAKMLLRLERPTSGQLTFDGRPIDVARDPREHWRRVQAVFQDPFAAFNQFFTIRSQLKSSFRLFPEKPTEDEMEQRVDEALRAVNIKPKEIQGKYPFELSGGQMQRMLLARIFILRPEVLIADEPTSMVDACSRASILDYLMKLKKELRMTIVFVTHDIGLAYYISDSIFIMHRGRIVEQGTPDQVTQAPESEITRQMLDDIPQVNREWISRGPRPELRKLA
ncbi:MAG TPA: dipeptide/oligopeptide/nickel ABC transporter ATP-binding protein [Polyangiaceae bacterium]|jgi:peptide/nickel transport system ATP-binding protein